MTIRLAPGLTLPTEAVTQTFGILAKRGAGKSNAAAVMAEEMFKAELPFVVVDPVGAWWGLRSSASGKGSGLPVPIFGGHRGDVPLERGGAELVADLIVDESLSCVVDVSAFESETAKREFLATFAERLFRRKGQPGKDAPLHLFLEEADDYVPQRATGAVARCLGAFQRIVKQGRARGLGATMITQRSAVLNKDVLTQIETLIVLRTTSPQDRKAISEWVKYHGQSEELLASLHTLAPGEAWVWSPWLELTKRVQIRRRNTFDSGATPTVAAKKAPATLADVNLQVLRERMASTIEKAKAEDPKELRRRLAAAETQMRDLQGKVRVLEAVRPKQVERVEVPVLSPEAEAALKALNNGVVTRLEEIGTAVLGLAKDISETSRRGLALKLPVQPLSDPRPSVAPIPVPRAPKAATATLERPDVITTPQQRILDAVAWLDSVGIEPNRIRVAFLAGYKPSTGHFNNMLGGCRTAGLVDYPGAGRVALTTAGAVAASVPDIPRSSEGLQGAVMERLNGAQRKILSVLIANYPEAVERTALADLSGYSAGTGHFNNVLGSIRSLGLIDYPSSGWVAALPVLFVEGVS